MRTLSAVEVPSAEHAARAVRHQREILDRYDCVVWADGPSLTVSLDLQGESVNQRVAAWRRIVAEELEVLGIPVVRYE